VIREKLLTPNEWSRPQRPLDQVRGIALHWVGNPNTSAEFNRRFFEDRKAGQTGYGSAHCIADTHEIIRCIPDAEMAYHVGAETYTDEALHLWGPYPNATLLGLELCHPDWSGQFEQATLLQARLLCAWWCWRYDLNPMSDITTHHAVTGKDCPRWFVQHPEDLDAFRDSVKATMIAALAA
jgi:N-acetylmuramoyl-L-alanine amidase